MGDRLRGKVAVVTGAGSGIGRACALRFAAEGARVVVNDLDPEAAARVVKEIEAAGGKGLAVPGDVSKRGEVDALIEAARSGFGRLDVLVNNAAAPQGLRQWPRRPAPRRLRRRRRTCLPVGVRAA